MKILFDTNVILDLFLDRNPHVFFAAELVAAVETGILQGVIAATSFTTIDYILYKSVGKSRTTSIIENLLKIFEVAPVTRVVLENALRSKFLDFEDSVIHESALAVGIQAIVTRDHDGFKESVISVYKPEELVKILEGLKEKNY